MSETTEAVAVPISLGDRDVMVTPPELGQLALLQHQVRVLKRDNVTKEEGARALDLAFRIARGRIVSKGDKDYVDDLLADGDLDLKGLVVAVIESVKQQPADAEDVKPVVRRGRPRKKV